MPDGIYSLVDEGWIPVRWRPEAGARELPDRVGLRDLLLRAGDIAGLDVPDAPAHAALLRVLYALTARVTGLDLAGPDWADRRVELLVEGRLPAGKGRPGGGGPPGVEGYLARWRERFFVFDPVGGRPWMQDARLREQCDRQNTAGVNKLIISRPSGNNHAWFRHGSDARPDLPAVPEAVLNLLVWHYWGPSGRCSAREVGGVKSASASAGPLRTALSYHPEGASLFETLLAGLVPPRSSDRQERDLCPWEWEELPDPAGVPLLPQGPCSRLTACSEHAVLLVPDESGQLVADAYVTWAFQGERRPRDDDFLIWQTSQQGNRYPRPADARRGLWRDLDALLLLEPSGTAQPVRPVVFRTAQEVTERLRVRALGFDQEGQAKDFQFVDASTPVVFDLVEERAPRTAPAVGRLRSMGEMFGWRLERAVRRAWAAYVDDAKADGDAWVGDAAGRYWPQAEKEFWSRFAGLDRSGESPDVGLNTGEARKAFLRLAEEAYEAVTATVTRTQRGAKAVSDARIELYGGNRKKK
ncbi:type I-E CRISPR-associated protein Cse1/CasA [Streptomyces sp. RerS4]|uniref:type I-E CRISPR-associated protein Cse1/CasA n=1 Tax=Streptomyces sp. RerS4 TaxID=2942449 RepID=UPI00201C5DD3|nr:type I-E CRISPR-associated protein Cse1/CasA [Streptomyces sp. RerS4]UQW99155.1 type I-E CRISPR-associated protein Cse1/CasA [Streptomyces sp. RerS4]